MASDLSQREEIIIKWAKENPEPVYPTWIDWLRDVGVSQRKKKHRTQ